MRRLQEQFPGELVVISVHSGKFSGEKRTDDLREAVLRHGIENPVVNDADFAVWRQYAVRAWPTLVLVGPDGYIVGVQSGEVMAEDVAPVIAGLIETFSVGGRRDRQALGLRPEAAAEPDRPLS